MTPESSSYEEEARYRQVVGLDGASPSTPDALIQALHDDSWRVRKAAAARLAELPDHAPIVLRLIEVLAERGQPGARNAAVEALVRLGDASAPALMRLLRHPDPEQRKFAADILGQMSARDAEPPLVEALDDPDVNVVAAAAEALGQIGGEAAGRALERLLKRPESLLKVCALEGLARLRRAPPMPEVVQLLGDATLQRSAYRVLGLILQPAAVELVCRGLHSEVRSIRQAALSALGLQYMASEPARLNELEATLRNALRKVTNIHQLLVEALASDDLEIKAGALFAAGSLKDSQLAVPVAEAAQDDRLAKEVAWALPRLGSVAGRELLAALSSLSTSARTAAAEALVGMADASWTSELLALLDSGEVELQLLAIRALGRSSSSEVAGALLPLLGDATLSLAVARALTSLGERFGQEVIPKLDAAVNARPTPGGIFALARLGGAGALPTLKRTLRDPEPLVRAAAAEASSQVGQEECLELVRLALADEVPRVRAAAVRALSNLPGPGAAPLLRRALADEDEAVQAAAVEAAGESGAVELAADLLPLVSGLDGLRASRAVRALARLGSLSAQALRAAAYHPDPEVAKEALASGAVLPESVEVAMELLSHPRWDVRAAAARVLGASGGASCLRAVAAVLAGETDPVARKAMDEAAQRLAER